MTRIYDIAKSTIESTPVWRSGEGVTIWTNGKAEVKIEAGPTISGRLDLVVYNGKRHRVQCGYFDPMKGWRFALDRNEYAKWVKRCGGRIDNERQEYEQLCQATQGHNDIPFMLEIGAAINAHPITVARIAAQHVDDVPLGELRADDTPGLRQEWREHHEKRAQRRHPEQPRYGLQFVSK